jgi:type IV fimbrial biogenesis protein FimT
MLASATKAAHRGFSLIEIMVAIAILGIVMAVGLPSFQSWIRNTQIRTMGESIQNGLRLARAEAVRRNQNVEFVLVTTDPPTAANAADVGDVNGQSWVVRVPAVGATPAVFIQGWGRSEGARNVQITSPAPAAVYRFNSFGRLVAPAAAPTLAITDPTLSASQARPLNVVVTTGGTIRMCDPHLALATNPQGCV